MPQDYLSDPADLDSPITSLRITLSTVDASNAATSDTVYGNVVFTDGSLLGNPENIPLIPQLSLPILGPVFAPGATETFELPIPAGLGKRVAEIDELYIRKSGSDGWLLGSALLFANDFDLPVLGNSEINQFLDNNEKMLFLRDWSTRSLCSSSDVPARFPLLCPHYRIAGPVLGHMTDGSANILYRVDREGQYLLRVFEAGTDPELEVFQQSQSLSPTATFRVGQLKADTHYRFRLFHLTLGEEIHESDGDGEFRTFPAEGSGVKFSFAFGSCSRNKRNVAQNAWTGIKTLAADPSISPCDDPPKTLRFFVHLGDSFYFYDDITDEEPENLKTAQAANLSVRRHPRFLDMARVVPSCALWDDHDFRINDGDSKGFDAIKESLQAFLEYWGNDTLAKTDPEAESFGLTTLLSYGNVDIYLMDGRFQRDRDENICFGQDQVNFITKKIKERGTIDRLIILASGSTWNHTNTGGDAYGRSTFKEEREGFYGTLNNLLGDEMKGLVFLSGDIHRNEIHEIVLSGPTDKVAPEFVSSPLGKNTSLKGAGDIEGERKWSVPSKGDDKKRGFATLEIDTTAAVADGGWTIKVSYYDENASIGSPYHTQDYTLSEGQFKFV